MPIFIIRMAIPGILFGPMTTIYTVFPATAGDLVKATGISASINWLERPQGLTGSLVNSMDEYGGSGEKKADNATWKACGQECIDGNFYCFVSRNVYGSESGDPSGRQTAFNSSLIKSTNRGLTWTRSAQTNYDSPMWPGPRFATPFFFHYGKNGGNVTVDNANNYVYAISTNGFWNCGDNMILGRVLRSKIANLSAADWTYYTDGDGMLDSYIQVQ